MTELKSCPFCNNNNLIVRAKPLFKWTDSTAIWIECSCGLMMYDFADDFIDLTENRERLAEKWNKRHE
jgi:hypothetical protein